MATADDTPAAPGTATPAPGPGPTLKVAAVARRLGVAPATLRTWARRYGLGPPAHTAGAHRQYTPNDLVRLLEMRRLTLAGVAPAEAARVVLDLAVDDDMARHAVTSIGLAPPPPTPATAPAQVVPEQERLPAGPTTATSVAPSVPGPAHPDPHPPTATLRGTVPPPARPPGNLSGEAAVAPDRLVGAAAALDAGALRDLLGTSLAVRGVLTTWEDAVAPALRADTGPAAPARPVLRQAWLEALHVRTVATAPAGPAPALLVTGPAAGPGEPAGDGPLAVAVLAAALAEHRVGTQVVSLPDADVLQALALGARPRIVVWHADRPVGEPWDGALARIEATTRVLLTGPGWDGVGAPRGAVRAASLTVAVDHVRLAVRH